MSTSDPAAFRPAPSEPPLSSPGPDGAADDDASEVADLDPVWRALGDPTRRALLDQLRERPQNTTTLCARFEHLSRQAVMKHLKVLERAGLIWVESRGRERINHLDVAPIEALYRRWLQPYQSYWLTHLHRLADEIGRNDVDVECPGDAVEDQTLDASDRRE